MNKLDCAAKHGSKPLPEATLRIVVIRTPCWRQLPLLEMSQPCSSALYLTRTAVSLVSATGRLDSKKHSFSQPTFEHSSPKIVIDLVKRSVPSSQSLTSRARLTDAVRRR